MFGENTLPARVQLTKEEIDIILDELFNQPLSDEELFRKFTRILSVNYFFNARGAVVNDGLDLLNLVKKYGDDPEKLRRKFHKLMKQAVNNENNYRKEQLKIKKELKKKHNLTDPMPENDIFGSAFGEEATPQKSPAVPRLDFREHAKRIRMVRKKAEENDAERLERIREKAKRKEIERLKRIRDAAREEESRRLKVG